MVAFSNLRHAPADQALERNVEQALLRHDPLLFRRVAVQARSGIVVLTGAVASFYAKSLAFRLAQRLDRVEGVVDALIVDALIVERPSAPVQADVSP